jgi:HEAT repeat protein
MAKKAGLFDSLFKKIGLKVYNFDDLEDCLRGLVDKEPEYRIKALEAIGTRRKLEDITPIIRVMREDENFQVQEAAMNVLGELMNHDAVDPLLEMLKAPDHWLRVKASMILGQLGDLTTLQAIKEAHGSVKGEYQATIERVIQKMETRKEVSEEIGAAEEKSPIEPQKPPELKAPEFKIPEFKGPDKAPLPFAPIRPDQYKENALLRELGRRDETPVPMPQPEPEPPQPVRPEKVPPMKPAPPVKTASPVRPAPPMKPDKAQMRAEEDKLLENLRFQLSRASASQADDQMVELYHRALTRADFEAEKALCASLKAPAESTKLQALQALIGLDRKPYIVASLLGVLDECSREMCWRIIVALCGVEDLNIAKRLSPFIDYQDEKIRKHAHNYFLIYRNRDMVDLLLEDFASLDERTKVVRASLIARMDADDITPSLAKLLQDPKQPEKVVLSILDKLPPRQEDVVIWSLPVLIRRKEESIIDAVQRFMKDSNNLLVTEYLRQNLFNNGELMRGRSALLLGQLKDLFSTPAIAKLLNDPSAYVRLKAGRSILTLGVKDYHKIFFTIVRKDPNLRNRLEFIQMIDQLYQEEALDVFLHMLEDSQSEIRCLVLDLLSRRTWSEKDREKIIDRAQPHLEDPDLRIVFYVIVLLVKLSSRTFSIEKKRLLSVLWTIIKEERNPAKIRKEALFSMLYLSKEDTREVLKNMVRNDNDEEMRVQAAVYMGGYEGKDVEDALIHACRSPNKNLAKAARESLRNVQIGTKAKA